MPSDPLDIDSVVASAGDGRWKGFPEGSVVGHVHLQVGAIPPAEAFYNGILGLAVTCRYPGGTFYAADGYHHHLATNIWNSRGAGERAYPSTGLANVEILASAEFIDPIRSRPIKPEPAYATPQDLSLRDPWRTKITMVTQAAENI
jgi:catechol 2,3-dioxygenase